MLAQVFLFCWACDVSSTKVLFGFIPESLEFTKGRGKEKYLVISNRVEATGMAAMLSVLHLPEVALEKIFSFLTYDEIAKNRIVSKKTLSSYALTYLSIPRRCRVFSRTYGIYRQCLISEN